MKKDKRIKIITLIAVILFFSLSIIYREQIKSLITKEILAYGLIILSIFSFLTDFLPQYISPHMLLIEVKILGLPKILSFGLIIISSLIGSIAGFEIGKKYGKKIVKKIYNKKDYNKLKRNLIKFGKWIILIAAISPLPYIPMIFGSLGIKRKIILIYGIIPRMIGLILFSLIISLF